MDISIETGQWILGALGAVGGFFILRLDGKFNKLEKKVDKLDEKIDKAIEKSEARLAEKLDRILQKLEKTEHDTVAIDRRLVVLETVRAESKTAPQNHPVRHSTRKNHRRVANE